MGWTADFHVLPADQVEKLAEDPDEYESAAVSFDTAVDQNRLVEGRSARISTCPTRDRAVSCRLCCTCTSLHPGGVRTKILDNQTWDSAAVLFLLRPILVEAPEGARTSVYLATTDRPDETAGKYFHYGLFRKGIYEKAGTALVNDEGLQERLWKTSEELIDEPFHISAD